MFAIVTIAGQQMKVSEGQEIFVHQLEASEGDKVSFAQVLLVEKLPMTFVIYSTNGTLLLIVLFKIQILRS